MNARRLAIQRSVSGVHMKRNANTPTPSTSKQNSEPSTQKIGQEGANGSSGDLAGILACLQTMRDGDFSVRLPGSWTGLSGKVADTFNEIAAANQQIANELKRVGHAVGKEGKTREHARFHELRGSWGEMAVSVNTLVEDLL